MRSFKRILLALAVIAMPAFSQSVTAPAISTIQSPTLGSGFYTPNSSTNPAYRGPNSPYASKQNSSSQEKQNTTLSESAENNSSDETTDFLSTLTASDIALLSQKGLLDQLGTLLGTDSTNLTSGTSISNLYSAKSSDASTEKLTQLIKQIEELKRQQALADVVPVTPNPKEEARVVAVLKKTPPHLLRFSVNGYDILKTCRTVYISDVQDDGTFLVTGDRKYLSDGKTRSETFHILFTLSNTNKGASSYSAATAVTQDEFNQYSFMYELSQRANMNATRTGNLVSMRTDDPQWKLELLIDLGD